MKTNAKLIRDGYANIITQDDGTTLTICPPRDRAVMLMNKVEEEVVELRQAWRELEEWEKNNGDPSVPSDIYWENVSKFKTKIFEEISDISVVLRSIEKFLDIPLGAKEEADKKIKKLGGFDNFIVLNKNEN